jgi:hypothetical protein
VNEFLQKLPAIWTKTLKNVCSPVPRQRSWKNIGFKRCQIISLPESPTRHGVALSKVQAIQVHYRLKIKHVANTQSYFKTGQSDVVLSSYAKKWKWQLTCRMSIYKNWSSQNTCNCSIFTHNSTSKVVQIFLLLIQLHALQTPLRPCKQLTTFTLYNTLKTKLHCYVKWILISLGSCDRASWVIEWEKTNKIQQSDVYYRCLSQHVSGIIMPIFRRTKTVLLHVVCCAGSAGCGW